MAVAEIAIKQEAVEAEEGGQHSDPVNLEDRILELCTEHPKGITDEMIVADQPSIDTVKRMKALQRLLSMVRVRVRENCNSLACGGVSCGGRGQPASTCL